MLGRLGGDPDRFHRRAAVAAPVPAGFAVLRLAQQAIDAGVIRSVQGISTRAR